MQPSSRSRVLSSISILVRRMPRMRLLIACQSFIATGIDRNALGGDGAPVRHAQQIVGERARPEDIAAQVLHAAERGKRLLLPGRTAKLAWWVSRFAPAYYARAMARRFRKEMQ